MEEDTELLKQKLYMMLCGRKGRFLYDRNLGSEICDVDFFDADSIEKVTSKARTAVKAIENAEVTDVEKVQGEFWIYIEVNGEVYVVKAGENNG